MVGKHVFCTNKSNSVIARALLTLRCLNKKNTNVLEEKNHRSSKHLSEPKFLAKLKSCAKALYLTVISVRNNQIYSGDLLQIIFKDKAKEGCLVFYYLKVWVYPHPRHGNKGSFSDTGKGLN